MQFLALPKLLLCGADGDASARRWNADVAAKPSRDEPPISRRSRRVIPLHMCFGEPRIRSMSPFFSWLRSGSVVAVLRTMPIVPNSEIPVEVGSSRKASAPRSPLRQATILRHSEVGKPVDLPDEGESESMTKRVRCCVGILLGISAATATSCAGESTKPTDPKQVFFETERVHQIHLELSAAEWR